MRLVQITDLHINSHGEDTHGVDVRNNFNQIIAELKKINFDVLIISGDICLSKGDKEVYRWFQLKIIELKQI